MRELAQWFRANVPPHERLRSYLQGPDSEANKSRVLGELAVLLARGEFLLGWAFRGGVGRGNWEEGAGDAGRGENVGEFPLEYLKNAAALTENTTLSAIASNPRFDTAGERRANLAWCTAFVGSVMGQLGFEHNADRTRTSQAVFLSTTRLRHWSKTGQSIGGTQLHEEGAPAHHTRQPVEATCRARAGSGAGERGRVVLRRAGLRAAGGDIILAAGHTAMVESYDPSTAVVATIEGNAGSAVRSRDVSLADPDDAALDQDARAAPGRALRRRRGADHREHRRRRDPRRGAPAGLGDRRPDGLRGLARSGRDRQRRRCTQTWQGGAYGGSETR